MAFNKAKFKELVLYFAKQGENDMYMGSVKLNKLLFYADFLAYGYLGHSITGARYIHLPQGPGPSELLPVRNEMEKEGKLRQEKVYRLNHFQWRPVALDAPNISLFSKEELDICQDAIRLLQNCPAEEISDRSHNWLGWIYADTKETIPYETVFIRSREPITFSDIAWAKQNMPQQGQA